MGVNVIPEKLAAFRVYLDGDTDLLGVADIQLPSFDFQTDTVSGAGILGEYESPNIGHTASMKFTLNWRTITKNFFSFLESDSIRLDCRAPFQQYDAGKAEYDLLVTRVVVQGITTKADLGKLETGAKSDSSIELEVKYIKIEIDGKPAVEYDKENYKFVVNGVDRMSKLRTALGI